MNALDWVIVSILGIGFVTGFIKGVIKQAFSLGGLILGIVCGTLLFRPFAGFLQNILNMSDQTARIVAFVIILLVVPILCGLLGKLLSKLVHAASLGFVDRLIGALFGLVKFIIFMGLVILLLEITGLGDRIVNNEEKKQSQLYVPVRNFSSFCLRWTWNKVQENADDLIPDFKDNPEQKDTDNTDQKKV